MKYNSLWNYEQGYMIRTTGVARWNTYMKSIGSFGQKQNVVTWVLTEIYILQRHFHYSNMTK